MQQVHVPCQQRASRSGSRGSRAARGGATIAGRSMTPTGARRSTRRWLLQIGPAMHVEGKCADAESAGNMSRLQKSTPYIVRDLGKGLAGGFDTLVDQG